MGQALTLMHLCATNAVGDERIVSLIALIYILVTFGINMHSRSTILMALCFKWHKD